MGGRDSASRIVTEYSNLPRTGTSRFLGESRQVTGRGPTSHLGLPQPGPASGGGRTRGPVASRTGTTVVPGLLVTHRVRGGARVSEHTRSESWSPGSQTSELRVLRVLHGHRGSRGRVSGVVLRDVGGRTGGSGTWKEDMGGPGPGRGGGLTREVKEWVAFGPGRDSGGSSPSPSPTRVGGQFR